MMPSQLKTAIRAGDLEKVRRLIAGGVDVTAAFADGTTPIQLAAREGQVTILRALAAAGASLSDLDILDMQERLKLFVESSLDQLRDEDLLSPGDLSAWAMQAVGERMDDKLAAEIADFEGPVFRAVRTYDLDLLKERVEAGDDVNQTCAVTRDSPLTRAVRAGDEDIVRALIDAGADVDHTGYSTPLAFALPDLRMAKLLIEAGADVYARGLDYQTVLDRAVHRVVCASCAEDSLLLVRFLLEAGVNPAHSESGEGTLLLEAEISQAWELYHELLPHYPYEIAAESMDELRDKQDLEEIEGGAMRWSYDLRFAAREGKVEELRQLIEEGRGYTAKAKDDSSYRTDVARQSGLAIKEALAATELTPKVRLEVLRLLIDSGADLNAAEGYEKRRGSSVLAAAAESWQPRLGPAIDLLIEAGADVDQRGSFERTPLMYAVLVAYRHGAALKKAIPRWLSAGADPNLADKFGHTAWTLAKAPLIEAEERARYGDALGRVEPYFDGPDLSEFFSKSANRSDQRRDPAARCRRALELLEAAGAEPRGEAELRLVLAAAAGDAERVEELLAAGAAAGARGTDGYPAIVAAAELGRRDIVDRLIEAGADVDASLAGEPGALEIAVTRGDLEMTRQLMDAGANLLSVACFSTRKPLAAAEAAGATEIVEMIRGALPPELAHIDRDVEAEIAADDLSYESQRELPRHAADGNLDKIRELLAIDDVEADGFDALRRTPLMAAAEAGRIDTVRFLIEAGADVGKCNEVIASPRSTPLVCAAIGSSARRDEVMKLLLEAGADPDQVGADGRTALMHAVERDVGFFGRIGEPALSTRTLIAAGADLEIRDPFGLTAWGRALCLGTLIDLDDVAEQYKEIAGILEKAGASTDDRRAIELLWLVMMHEKEEIADYLEDGVRPDVRRFDGATALIMAVRDGELDIARLLVEAGCDVDAREWVDRGPTAVEIAEKESRHDIVRVLTGAGAAKS